MVDGVENPTLLCGRMKTKVVKEAEKEVQTAAEERKKAGKERLTRVVSIQPSSAGVCAWNENVRVRVRVFVRLCACFLRLFRVCGLLGLLCVC